MLKAIQRIYNAFSRLDLAQLLDSLRLASLSDIMDTLRFSFQALQVLYFFGMRRILLQIFVHQAAAALDDVVQHLLWAALTDP